VKYHCGPFYRKNLNFRSKNGELLDIFEKEYETAKQELSVAQAALEDFRTQKTHGWAEHGGAADRGQPYIPRN